jgi:hypothetical protein
MVANKKRFPALNIGYSYLGIPQYTNLASLLFYKAVSFGCGLRFHVGFFMLKNRLKAA